MEVPDSLNAYARYYEERLYKQAPFRSRPNDLLSVVASHTGYSNYFTDNFVKSGKSVWRSGYTNTGSYSLQASPGNYLGVGLSYVYGLTISPRVPNTFICIAGLATYF